MGWLSDIFKPVTDVANKAIDLIPTEEGRLKARAEFLKTIAEAQSKLDSEITKRQASDMASDSFLAKNIRPAVCIVFTIYIFILPFLHDIPTPIMDLYTNIAISVYGFYFGSMSLEKIAPLFFKKKD
ncbi:hypothetical protein BKH41_00735 [Helicobacter sp. 12S02232-10]|uniref:hypothetical protein n=1 Tax=Helicobacter sp. 12S02232-10 TaxID=1476197 RepID=UPI000BA7CC3F|nr:hypothetical protein [Helicobacter sp. 12S02232-10]PAF49861.1 hypothetical protein BKH41_00735 [Helicobacter sp. 12S02232-10]